MCRTILSVLVCAVILISCNGTGGSASTATSLPMTSTVVAMPTIGSASQPISEIELETQTGTSYTLDWSSDGKTLAVSSGFEITLLSEDLNEIIEVLKPEGGALGVTWSPDGKQFAVVNGFRNPTLGIWDWDSANNQLTLNRHIQAGSDQYGVAWSPNGKLLATLGNDRKSVIQFWDTNTWKEIRKFELDYANPRRALNWSADSTTIYDAGEVNGQVVMFGLNVSRGIVDDLATASMGQADVFAISSNAKRIAIADSNGRVRVFDPSSPKLLMEFQSVGQPSDMVWNPNGTTLAILDYMTTLQLWEIPH
jgi:WD40 repeat protein